MGNGGTIVLSEDTTTTVIAAIEDNPTAAIPIVFKILLPNTLVNTFPLTETDSLAASTFA